MFAAQLAREALGTNWLKLEIHPDPKYLMPDPIELTTTTENPGEVSKIRGLGYIGLMASGGHHQLHHWAMATGVNPHARHQ